PYSGLDPGAKSHETIHFSVRAYSTEKAVKYAELLEKNYQRIMNDVGIYSFMPSRPYNAIIYADSGEYLSKTGMPEWSGGIAYGNALLLYDSPDAEPTIAHETTHLVFNEFMGLSNLDRKELKWINEGIAVYEEVQPGNLSRVFYENYFRQDVAKNPMPFSQMISFAPLKEENRSANRWYCQAGSVARFMLEKGGSIGFAIFLSKLKDGQTLDAALKIAFPGRWQSLDELEKSWLITIQQ
ncbi:MAG: hypothetical protein HY746_05900, partial [Elusimicrobia bacterium]|nr:hypothetical protein [Elusimicrobiota bacterium]